MYCEILFEENMKANLQYVINTKIHNNPSISIQNFAWFTNLRETHA